ncbi:MAG: hemolysin family protein [Devosia ginsengisoli]|nr:hemolysin family protein [Devosia ginsengisoli]MCR6670437.1 hemolysin family protein [Devosia ginsengisoli]
MNALLGLLLIALLVMISILIALAEIAFAAAREIRIRALAEQGDARALRFIKLRANAGNVITALQISTNAVSILAGIVGSEFLAPYFAALLSPLMPIENAETLGGILSFVLVTALFILLADLTPRRIAMMMPERVALFVGGFLEIQVRMLKPLVWIFSSLSDRLIALLRLKPERNDEVTGEDFRMILAGGEASGALMKNEHQLIKNVLALELRSVTSVMTVRDSITYLDIRDSTEIQREKVQQFPFSRYPLCDGGLDNVIGCVRAEDALAAAFEHSSSVDFREARRDVLSVPDSLNVWEVMAEFQAQNTGFALVVSEYAYVVGIVTFKDLMAALVQGLVNPFEEKPILRREDNSYLIDGVTPWSRWRRRSGSSNCMAMAITKPLAASSSITCAAPPARAIASMPAAIRSKWSTLTACASTSCSSPSKSARPRLPNPANSLPSAQQLGEPLRCAHIQLCARLQR